MMLPPELLICHVAEGVVREFLEMQVGHP